MSERKVRTDLEFINSILLWLTQSGQEEPDQWAADLIEYQVDRVAELEAQVATLQEEKTLQLLADSGAVDDCFVKVGKKLWEHTKAEVERLRKLVSERVDECECADCVDEQIWEPGGGSHSTAPVPVCWNCRARAALEGQGDE